MKITGTNPIALGGSAPEDVMVLRQLRAQLRSLGDDVGGQFAVVRDPATQRFVVQVLDPESKVVIDQFPVESILKQLPPDE